MRKKLVRVGGSLAILAALAVAACGKSSAPASPSAPTGSGAPSQPGGSASGATIAGTVMSSAGTSSVRTMGGSIVVSIVGTNMSVTVDGSGRFTLQNVPAGDVTLSFTGNGIDARVTISGVGANDQIRITVRVNGNVVDVDQNEHQMANNQAELEGRVSATSCPQTITVGTMTPTTVNVQNARIRHGDTTLTCSQIQVNDHVEAKGTKNGTTFVATEVKVETEHGVEHAPGDDDNHDEDKNEAEVNGTVSGAAAGHTCPAFTFSVGSTTVTTTANTRFDDVSCAGVVNGIGVEVKGTRTSPTAITATRVEKK
jgi:Domain of unknown function (DUF5666)